MTLSIIIPTYNSAIVLQRALDSIVDQTFTDWEVLVMDGVSTDDTLKVAQSYNDNRIRIYSEPDKGIYDAMNKGIKKAQGEWLYFLGSDDYLLTQDTLQTLFSHDIDNYDVVYGDVQSPSLPIIHRKEWTLNNITANRCHQAIFFKKKIFSKLKLYDTQYLYLADFEFNLRWFLSKHVKNKYIPIEIAYFSPNGVSEKNTDDIFWKKFDYLVIKYGYLKLNTTNRIFYLSNAIEKEDSICRRFIMSILLHYNKIRKRIRKHLQHI